MMESALPVGDSELLEGSDFRTRRHFPRARYSYSCGCRGVCGRCRCRVAGARLLADVADRTTLIARLAEVFAARTARQTVHDLGRVLVDVAVMLADGGECISDIAMLAEQGDLFAPVASDSTC
jgi:hypothetical protein